MSIGLTTIIMWIGMTAIGTIVSSINLWATYGDYKYQATKSNQRWQRLLTAKVNMAEETMRVVAHVGLFVAGVMVAWRTEFNPNPPGTSLYVRCVILSVIAIFLAQTFVHRWLRHRLLKPEG